MQLQKHLAQGRLLYFTRSTDAISVSENDHYRWLAFGSQNTAQESVIQSVMHKRKPWQLTLPHQTAMMLPLLFFRPKTVVELGLGGGNLGRFLHHTCHDVELYSIECSSDVITSYKKYFNPNNIPVNLIENDGSTWLQQQKNVEFHWLLSDVYQQQLQSFDKTINQLEVLTDHLNDDCCLSINLPDASDSEVNLCLTVLQQLQSNHHIVYFHVPNYLNIIIHLIPKHWQTYKLKNNKKSPLAKNVFSRWREFWLHGKQTNL
jgi:spermidine synthase